ncbi:MAG: STAS domain-containing protein [Phycisphaerales bacterium]
MFFSHRRTRSAKGNEDRHASSASQEVARLAEAMSAMKTPVAHIEVLGRTLVATVQEPELTAPKAADLRDELLIKLATRPDSRHVVLDFQNVDYLDSACLGMLLHIHREIRSRGGRMAIASAKTRVEGLFKLTRLEQLFPMKRSVIDAVNVVEQLQ